MNCEKLFELVLINYRHFEGMKKFMTKEKIEDFREIKRSKENKMQ